MLRLIIFIILFFIVYQTFKAFMRLISNQNRKEVDSDIRNVKQKKRYDIKQGDIVEAKFEEIKDEDDEKNNDEEKK